jgi:outer membrane protein insertion porin family
MRKHLILLIISLFFSLGIAQSINRTIVSDIVFIGDFYLSDKKMTSAMELKKSIIFNPSDMKSTVDKLLTFHREQGYLYAQIDSVSTRYTLDKKEVRLIFYGFSGSQTHYGTIEIIADSLNVKQYRQFLDIKENDVYAPVLLENNFQYLLNYAADNGYPFTKIEIDKLSFRQVKNKNYADIILKIQEGRKVYIAGANLSGNIYTNENVILRELELSKGNVYSKHQIDKIPERLMRLQIFKDVKISGISMMTEDSVIINIKVEEGNSIMADGVIGYVPQSSGDESGGDFNGLFNLSLNNIFGTARKFEVHWQKPDNYSEEFNLNYTEPWIFNYPIDTRIGLDRTVRDSTFIKWNTYLNVRFRIIKNLSALAGINRKLAFPDSVSSRNNRLLRNEVINLELGLEYDTRDYPLNPRSGLYYTNSYSYGFKNNYGPSYLFSEDSVSKKEELQILQLKFGWYYNLWLNQVLSLELNAKQVKGDQLQLTDLFWFGGSQSLRGYRENQYWGKVIAWANLEYRFILNRNSRLFVFSDWGFYQSLNDSNVKDDVLPGYGLGIRFETPLGIMGVDYGLGKGDSFRDGKIHFGITSRF